MSDKSDRREKAIRAFVLCSLVLLPLLAVIFAWGKFIATKVQVDDLEAYAESNAMKIAAEVVGLDCDMAVLILRQQVDTMSLLTVEEDSITCVKTDDEVRITLQFTVPINYILFIYDYAVDRTLVAPLIASNGG